MPRRNHLPIPVTSHPEIPNRHCDAIDQFAGVAGLNDQVLRADWLEIATHCAKSLVTIRRLASVPDVRFRHAAVLLTGVRRLGNLMRHISVRRQ